MIPIILSGGSGTRLWPLSRKHKPKQFLSLFGDESMFQQTLTRLSGVAGLQAPYVVCNNDHRFMVAEQLQELSVSDATIILEPCARNTAPAIAVACLQALQQEDDPVMLVLAADHLIKNIAAFHQAIEQAQQQAEQGKLVTFGIKPLLAHTGYGYIKAKQKDVVSEVDGFVEKPDLKTAESYLAAGNYLWNSGMFMFRASVFVDELAKFAPEMLDAAQQSLQLAKRDLDFLRIDKTAFEACPSDSIDYAVMEKTDKAMVVPLDADWSDVGSWSSLWAASEKDEFNNVLNGDVIISDVNNAIVHSENRLVSVVGLDDVVVVETADAVMVADKNKAEDVKTIVAGLQSKNRAEAVTHRLCYRPWGYYDSIDVGERFQVKRITVKPGASLSLQMHHHRAEHWVVVKGTAEVTCGDKTLLVSENESTFIPLGTKHRLHNPGVVPLEIIEVQSGSYLGEDDIIRFEDNYNRD